MDRLDWFSYVPLLVLADRGLREARMNCLQAVEQCAIRVRQGIVSCGGGDGGVLSATKVVVPVPLLLGISQVSEVAFPAT